MRDIWYDQILENLPFGHKQTLAKTQLKIKFFAHFDKKLLAVKFHTKSFFFLGDMDDYIRMTNVRFSKIQSHNYIKISR